MLRTLRQPAQIVPSLVFPLFLLALNTGGLDAATDLPGFPTDSYITFALAVPFIQSGIFAVSNGGADLARDIETGFMNRLALTPLTGLGLVLGQLAGTVCLGVLQAIIYLTVGLAAGASFEAGLSGVAVLLGLAFSISLMFGAIGVFAALRLGTAEAVQGLFPLLFVFLFISSMALPRPLMEQDWFRTLATYNPVSYLIEGVRSLFIEGFDGEALALGFGLAALIAAFFLTAASLALMTRMERT